jgi:hypothetical protein
MAHNEIDIHTDSAVSTGASTLCIAWMRSLGRNGAVGQEPALVSRCAR